MHSTLSGQIAYLEKLSYQRLRDWTLEALAFGNTGSLDLSRYPELTEAVRDLVVQSRDHKFQDRFRRVIASLINHWSSDFEGHTPRYLSRLTVLAGQLNVAASSAKLVRLARSGRFKTERPDGDNLHATILRAIWGMDLVGRETRRIFADEIDEIDSPFALLCFTALYQTEFRDGLVKLRQMVKRAVHLRRHDEFNRLFRRFIHSASNAELRAFGLELPKIVHGLDYAELIVLRNALRYAGCELAPMGIYMVPGGRKRCLLKVGPAYGKKPVMVEMRCIPGLQDLQMSLEAVKERVDADIRELTPAVQLVMPSLTLNAFD